MSSDGGLRAEIRSRLGHLGHWISVETGGTDQGVPDLNICARGVETWIECKWTTGWAVGMRPEQVGWADTRIRRGGRVLIAVRRTCRGGPRSVACDDLYVFDGRHAREVKTGGIRCGAAPLLHTTGGPGRWRWDLLGALLLAKQRPRQPAGASGRRAGGGG